MNTDALIGTDSRRSISSLKLWQACPSNMKPLIPPGTLVLWRKKYLRTVLSSSPGYVTLAIRNRSWTNRARTTYTVGELLCLGCVFLDKKAKGPLLKSELEVLKARKFDPRKELARELKEAKELAERTDRPVCCGFARLKKLTKNL